MLLFTIYVNDEYTTKKMELTCKKLRNKIEMRWQWVKNGKKMIIACDFYNYDD